MTEFLDALREYFAIGIGLLLGATAHFGSRIAGGDEIGWRGFLGYTMQLGMVGLVASVATRVANITDNDMRATCAAILAVSANEVIQWLKRNGWLRFLDNIAPAPRDRSDARGDQNDPKG